MFYTNVDEMIRDLQGLNLEDVGKLIEAAKKHRFNLTKFKDGKIPDHGTDSRYRWTKDPCRCKACRSAHATARAMERARYKLPKLTPKYIIGGRDYEMEPALTLEDIRGFRNDVAG